MLLDIYPDFPDFPFEGDFPFGGYGDFQMVLQMIWSIFAVVMAVLLLFGVVFLVFQGLGLMRIAKRKGIPNGWMGFVPILSLYTLGKVSSTPELRKRPEIPLLILGVLSALFSVISLAYLMPMMEIMFRGALEGGFYSNDIPERLVGMLGKGAFASFAAAGLSIALMVLMFIALHRVYKQFSPNNASVMTVFTVLAYALLGVPIHPFILFAIRNNPSPYAPDEPYDGAPPRAPAEAPALKPPAQGYATEYESPRQGYTTPLEPPAQGYATSLDPPPSPSVKTPEDEE